MASAVRQIQISASILWFVARGCRAGAGRDSNLSGAAGQLFNTFLRDHAGRRVATRLPAWPGYYSQAAAVAAPPFTALFAAMAPNRTTRPPAGRAPPGHG